ncbi:hypothetical protein P692DRAFT_201508732 [Suillus brevipes Sb2]|nr:hypothetical protein P692DRAFT_201508732 [Suillus brevipes Sb2]
MDHTASSPSRQSSPICVPFSRSHSRSEPSKEHVIICRLPGKCTTPRTSSVWPSIVWRGMMAGILLVEEDMVRSGGSARADRVYKRSLSESWNETSLPGNDNDCWTDDVCRCCEIRDHHARDLCGYPKSLASPGYNHQGSMGVRLGVEGSRLFMPFLGFNISLYTPPVLPTCVRNPDVSVSMISFELGLRRNRKLIVSNPGNFSDTA